MGRKVVRMRRGAYALALAGTLAIAGCGGNSGTQTVATQTVSGTVADGYLEGANVFLDKNGNKTKDAGEPSATTNANGAYEMKDVPAADVAAYPVVVDVPPTAIDKDTGVAVGGAGYVLSAPAGKPEFVSPVTTLIQNQIEANPTLTVAAAESTVKSQLGVSSTVSLFDDFVQKKNDVLNPNADDYAKIHNVAQVVATAINNNMGAIQTAAPTVKLEEIIKIVVNEVMNQLTTIASTVTTTREPLTAEQKAAGVSAVSANIPTDATTIAQLATEVSIKPTVSSFQKVMEGTGFFWLDAYKDYSMVKYEYGNVKFGTTAGTLAETSYDYLDGTWTASTDNDQEYILTSTGWVLTSDDAASGTITLNADSTVTWTHKVTGNKMTISVATLDVSGKPVASFTTQQGITVKDSTTVFPAGSEAYRLTMTALQDEYQIWAGDGSYENKIYIYDGQTSKVATALTDILDGFAEGKPSKLWISQNLSAQFTGSGTKGGVNFYKYDYQVGQQGNYTKLDLTGTWESKVVNGQNILVVSVPLAYKTDQYSYDDEPVSDPIFAVVGDVVKPGRVRYGNVPKTERGYNFNKTAFDVILANFVASSGTTAPAKALAKR